jgi:hypothetical protein
VVGSAPTGGTGWITRVGAGGASGRSISVVVGFCTGGLTVASSIGAGGSSSVGAGSARVAASESAGTDPTRTGVGTVIGIRSG